MKQGWEIKKLGDVCDRASSNVSQNQLENEDGEYPIFGASGLIKNVSFYHQEKPYLSIVKDGSGVGRVTKMDAFTSVIGTLQYILPKEGINLDYLNYSLMSVDFKKYVTGAAIPHIYFKDYKDEPFLWMPLAEQQHIVSILDEAFAAIAKAKANAEQNLKNAKELFESYLQGVFEKKGEGWEHIRLGDVCQINDGTHFSPKNTDQGRYMYITAKNIKPYYIDLTKISYISEKDHKDIYSRCSPKKGDVLYIKDGATAGIAALNTLDEEFSLLSSVALLKCSSKILNTFLVHYMNSSIGKKNFLGYVDGAAITRLTLIKIKNIGFPLPPLKTQNAIVQKLDALSFETKKLEKIYKQKLSDLEELKKSILQKAFSGELSTIVSIAKSVAVPDKINNISVTDLQAGITVIALQKHLRKGKENTFHHVKAEKIVNMAQYFLNIELERHPVKDAAGPNDFPHAKKVESRAAKAGFYTVDKTDGFYNYRLGRQADTLAEKVMACLSEKSTTLNWLIDLMVPMNTEQAEVVATVYAAWNNLLIDGAAITDEAIVYEARENWHKKKLDIPREKFFKAINWMKNKNLVPTGTGKKVVSKQAH